MFKLDFLAEPYEIRPTSFWGWYDVVFEEDSVILGVRGREEALRIASALNGAYNLGRSFELIRQEVAQEPAHDQPILQA